MKEEERPTFFCGDELETLERHCRNHRFDDALEIGTYCGCSAKHLLRGASGMVFSVDPLIHPSVKRDVQESWIARLAEMYPKRFVFLNDYSYNIARTWRREVDVLLIDGDHSRAAVTKDLQLFVPFLRVGGTLILDDTTHPPVEEARLHFMSSSGFRWEPLIQGKLQFWRKHSA